MHKLLQHTFFSAQQRGLSLVELLVSLVVSSLLLLGVTSLYLSSRQTDSLGMELAKLQETGRQAIDFLARDIRMAGYQGCMDPETLKVNVLAKKAPTSNILATALRGFEVTNTSWANGLEFDNETIETRALIGSDVLAIQKASTEDVQLKTAMNNNLEEIEIDGNPLGFQKDDLVIIASCENAELFRITNSPATSGNIKLFHDSTANSSAYLQATYDTSAKVMGFESVAYFVADTGRVSEQGLPLRALYRQRDLMPPAGNNFVIEELIEGIDSMQILYGERLSTGNIHFVTANNVTNMQEVESIKIGFLVSSSSEVLSTNDTLVYRLPGEDISPVGTSGAQVTHAGDRRLRREFSSTINIRNRREN